MSKDVKLFNGCNHIVNNTQYEAQLCPKCYGKGYYFDIYFDLNGQTVTTTKSIKLQQEMLKVIIDQKYTNDFHVNWGSELQGLIGKKKLSNIIPKLEMAIRNALIHLKSTQESNNNDFNNMNDSEILDVINYIEILPLGATGYKVNVYVTNKIGEIIEEQFIL